MGMGRIEPLDEGEQLALDLILGSVDPAPHGALPAGVRGLRDSDMIPVRVGFLRKLVRLASVGPVDK